MLLHWWWDGALDSTSGLLEDVALIAWKDGSAVRKAIAPVSGSCRGERHGAGLQGKRHRVPPGHGVKA